MVVPIVLAITARRSCARCSSSESGLVSNPASVIEASPPMSSGPVFIRAPAVDHLVVYYRNKAGKQPDSSPDLENPETSRLVGLKRS
jgi:hypothetical protein